MKSLGSLLRTKCSTLVLVLIGAAIAIVYLAATFSPAFLLGTSVFWDNPRGIWLTDSHATEPNFDMLQVIGGYIAFLHQGWTLPLFYVSSIGTPAGTNIIFLDAVPIVSLIGKIASQIVGHALNPFGVWIAVCVILSAVFAALCVAEFGQRTVLAAAAAAILSISAPPLLYRFGHLPLLAHWIVLCALYLYLRNRRDPPLLQHLVPWTGLLCTALLVNVYLFVMAGSLFAAVFLQRLSSVWPSVRRSIIEAGTIVVAIALVAGIAGHFGKGTSATPFTKGFGFYSMNLMSPVWPQKSGLLPVFDTVLDATAGQYEGFNYFGIGALLLIVAGAWRGRGYIRQAVSHHVWLLIVFASLFVDCLSDRIFAGHYLLLDYRFSEEVDWIAGMFRSSGRMFWPIFYCTMLYALVLCLRTLRPFRAAAFIIVCCALQLIDTNPLRTRMTAFSDAKPDFVLDQAQWRDRMQRAAAIFVTPSFQCDGPRVVNVELTWFAEAVSRPINSIYAGRRTVDCNAEATAVRDGPYRTDTLYVLLAGTGSSPATSVLRKDLNCEAFPEGEWCLGPADPTRKDNAPP